MTQKEQVIQQIKHGGSVSRNWALQNFISRLGAIICDLNKHGYNLVGRYEEQEHGKDFVYVNQTDSQVMGILRMGELRKEEPKQLQAFPPNNY